MIDHRIVINDGQSDRWATDIYSLRAYVDYAGWDVLQFGDAVFVDMPYDDEEGEPNQYADFCNSLPVIPVSDHDMENLHQFVAREDIAYLSGDAWEIDAEIWRAAEIDRDRGYDLIALTGVRDNDDTGVMSYVEGGKCLWIVRWDSQAKTFVDFPSSPLIVLGPETKESERQVVLDDARALDPRYLNEDAA